MTKDIHDLFSAASQANPQNAELTGPRVAVLLYDGLCTFEFGIASEIFGLHRPEMGASWYRYLGAAIENGPLRAHGGFRFMPDCGDEALDTADIIVVPGWKGADVPVPEELCLKLRAAHARGARLISICSGAFVLAATGLLDGEVLTTHWRYAALLQGRYPRVEVDENALYRKENRIYTSAGSAAGIDLLIDVVREDFGAAAANSVARRLVMSAHRAGGQAQFLERPVPKGGETALGPLLDTLRSDLSSPWTVAKMAAQLGLTERTFLRRFQSATGTTPGEWLVLERLEAAKSLLCQGQRNIDFIAGEVGFGSAHTLRHHFRAKLGLTPTEFRSRFLEETVR